MKNEITINVLGMPYRILHKDYDEEPSFKEQDFAGFCDGYAKEIVICNMETYAGWENESPKTALAFQRTTLRHEIVHAFLYESGLADNSGSTDAWAVNEEMVDWIARQGEKIFNAWTWAESEEPYAQNRT